MKQIASKSALIFAAAIAATGAYALADTFQINPITVTIQAPAKSADVSVVNHSTTEMRFTLVGGAWTQGETNGLPIAPTDNLLVFPEIFRLAPGATQRVRVSILSPGSGSEQAFRLYVEQLPALARPHAGHPTINVVTRVGIPIFLSGAAGSTATPTIANTKATRSSVTMDLRNQGNVHVAPSTLSVSVRANNRVVWSANRAVWYVLAGEQTSVAVAFPSGVCASGRTVDLMWKSASANKIAQIACP
jgi:fimbrial chaperone protein